MKTLEQIEEIYNPDLIKELDNHLENQGSIGGVTVLQIINDYISKKQTFKNYIWRLTCKKT
jgi:hypothetical protein